MSVGKMRDLKAVTPAGRPWRLAVLLCAAWAVSLLGGCAAVTNPVANGVEVRKLPPELLGHTRELPPLPFDKLGQEPPADYRLDAGDVLGIWIEGVLGEAGQAPPVIPTPPAGVFRPPAVGFPIPVGSDGALRLPLVEPVRVAGLTVPQAEEAIRQAYTVKRQILRPGRERIIVTLASPRQYAVLIIRDDAGGVIFGSTGGSVGGGAVSASGAGVAATGTGNIGNKRGSGSVVYLPAYQNDVLHALAATGGLPGLDARNEVIVLHRNKGNQGGAPAGAACPPGGPVPPGGVAMPEGQVVRIPLRIAPGAALPFRPEDVVLQAGDIVYIPARDGDLFYTGGLLPPGEFVLPRDYDLDAVTAVMRLYPVVNNFVTNTGFVSTIANGGTTGPPIPSLLTILRKTGDGGQVAIRVNVNQALANPAERVIIQPGDLLILQQTPGEALVTYLNTVLRFNFLGTIIRQRDLTATATLNLF